MSPWLVDVIGLMQNSAMNVHVHCGFEGRCPAASPWRAGDEACLAPTVYAAAREICGSSECCLLRMPCLTIMSSSTRPTFSSGVTERMFTDYLAREIARLDQDPSRGSWSVAYIMNMVLPRTIGVNIFLRLYGHARSRLLTGNSGYGEPAARMIAGMGPSPSAVPSPLPPAPAAPVVTVAAGVRPLHPPISAMSCSQSRTIQSATGNPSRSLPT